MWLPKGGEAREGWTGSLGLADANYYIQTGTTTKQQGSTVQHRELHSVSCDKLLTLIQWKRIHIWNKWNAYIYVYIYNNKVLLYSTGNYIQYLVINC